MNARFSWLAWHPLASLLAELNRDGEAARVVGGAVRNALLGEPVEEWDVATTALPEVVTERCQTRKWRVVPTGIEHGTVTVLVEGHPFEVTTLREDIETFGRHAVVAFGRDFCVDARRRDFTINALSVEPDGTLHDYTGGLDDIAARSVRFIGEADTRIAEDYLRILRFFRFHARFGNGPPDPAGMAAVIRGRHGLAKLSRERIRAELLKLLAAPRATASLQAMADAGLIGLTLSVVPRLSALEALIADDAANGLPFEPMTRLAALACFVREDAERLATSLRLSNAEARDLAQIVTTAEAMRQPPDTPTLRRLVYRNGPAITASALRLAAARGEPAEWKTAIATAKAMPRPVLPWRGADIAARGVPAGKAIGDILADLEQRWMAAGFPDDHEGLDEMLRDAVAAGHSAMPPG